MLNNEIRPFLSRWHPQLRNWERRHPDQLESEWPKANECRQHLTAMQQRIVRYAVGYGELAAVPNMNDVMRGELGVEFTGAH
ncbi:hypothetical protein ACFQ1S_02415 [Kibdelosporangium lantanae]|uniref:Uncharacterized protein n=1 Tax=Kibdelosporangium lantanae TaxID=1497396 RepID=A0ABW3M1V5_9PSEU